MKRKSFFNTRSSLFVSIPALLIFAGLSAVSAVLRFPALCAAFAFFFFLCLIARCWGLAALRNVTLTCEGSPAALFPPGEVKMQFHIKNGKNLPLIWLELTQPLEQDAPLIPMDPGEICHMQSVSGRQGETACLHKKFTWIMGYEEIHWTSVWSARHRGIFRPDALHLQAGDGFGLAQSEQFIGDTSGHCVAVYPALQPVSAELFLREMWEATSGVRGYMEDPTIIKSTRNYMPSDSFKRINWRVTARTQKTVVNTFETISPKSAHFIIDCESFNGLSPQQEAFEDTLSILTSLLLRLNAAGMQCSVSLPRGKTSAAQTITGIDHTPLEEILFAFAGYQLQDVIVPEDTDQSPYTLPSAFGEHSILTLQNAGRFYYVCAQIDRGESGALLFRLDPARTTILPYTLPSQGQALPAFPVVGLTTLKKEAEHER